MYTILLNFALKLYLLNLVPIQYYNIVCIKFQFFFVLISEFGGWTYSFEVLAIWSLRPIQGGFTWQVEECLRF